MVVGATVKRTPLGLLVVGLLVSTLATPHLANGTTPTLSFIITPTPTKCPDDTPLTFWVDPVTSPTDQFFQVITVHIGSAERVDVITESGIYSATDELKASHPAEVRVGLFPSATAHIEVVAHVGAGTTPGGCTYGGYSLRTTTDRFGAPLTIVQEGTPPTPTPVIRDVSPFSEFQFERSPALGFCPPLDAVFSTVIHARPGGAYRLEMSVLEEGQRGIDECVSYCCSQVDCAVAIAQPSRDLSGAEIARMREVFSHLRVYAEPDPTCEFVAYDPCLINGAQWDDLGVADHPCRPSGRIDAAEVASITTFLEGLRSDRTPPPSPTPTPTIVQPTAQPTSTFLPEPSLVFDLAVEPAHPLVGERVTLTFSVVNTQGFAGQPGYGLIGAAPYFEGNNTPTIRPNTLVLGSVTATYDLVAVRAGRAELKLNVIYEICLGGAATQPCFRGGMTSQVFPVEVGDSTHAPSPSTTPTPSPEPTLTVTPTSSADGSGCSLAPFRPTAAAPIAVWLIPPVLIVLRRRP